MKLINCPEVDIPNEFYIFVDFNNLQTKENIEKTNCINSSAFLQHIDKTDKEFSSKYLKGIVSSFSPNRSNTDNFSEKYLNGSLNYLPFDINQNCDVNFISMFCRSITSEYTTEYNCEIHRKYNVPTYPSRLSSCYAFADFESCKAVSKKYNWDINTVRKFRLIPHKDNRVAKVNMEIISLERYANRVSSLDYNEQMKIWGSYWNSFGEIEIELPTINGRKTFKSGILWEYLVEGILQLTD